jgi:hypothetical protein
MSRVRTYLFGLDPLVVCALIEWRFRHLTVNPFRNRSWR